MKARILTNDPSLLVMFRLGSIEGKLVKNTSEAKEMFKNSIKDENLAVLILTRTIEEWINKELSLYKQKESIPLIVVIDDW